jgi:hypothetical protein
MFWEKHSHLGYSNRTKTKLCQDKNSNIIRVCMWAFWDIVETLVYIHIDFYTNLINYSPNLSLRMMKSGGSALIIHSPRFRSAKNIKYLLITILTISSISKI